MEGTLNMRDLGSLRTNDGRYISMNRLFRSANLAHITNNDIHTLAQLGVKTVVDLLGPKEALDHLDRVPAGTAIISSPIIGSDTGDAIDDTTIRALVFGADLPETMLDVARVRQYEPYYRMLFLVNSYGTDSHTSRLTKYRPFFRALLDLGSDKAMLVHCTGGRDRAGVGVALLLKALGVSQQDIEADFVASNQALQPDREDPNSTTFLRFKSANVFLQPPANKYSAYHDAPRKIPKPILLPALASTSTLLVPIHVVSNMSDDKFVQADKDGQFRRPASQFRFVIPSEKYAAEAGRYVLYFNYGCPWAHRTNIVRTLKGLEAIVELVEVDDMDPGPDKGWYFSGKFGPSCDPYTGVKYLRELYQLAEPGFVGRTTVPTLWDRKTNTIVNNDSAEIIRMFYTAFDHLLPESEREVSKGRSGLLPDAIKSDIEAMNTWVYGAINNGVYKAGFATTQEAYEENAYAVFDGLDRLEAHLDDSTYEGPYLFGRSISEADLRLFPTLIRFDVGYYMLMKVNLKMIRHDYPRLYEWLKRLYWDESDVTNGAFKSTTKFDRYKHGYSKVKGDVIVPLGPKPDIHPM
ncbi:hypothetical protein E4T44_00424 [Aureobasidium sp. EXF-8845]|nr:hypothetical protein E4T44_00424 [Aureobasidium sp. EXF-8845]KAI4858159.1 hypothetical protein E4T45_00333 [Aureobasidium sp. EXF-8846]